MFWGMPWWGWLVYAAAFAVFLRLMPRIMFRESRREHPSWVSDAEWKKFLEDNRLT